MRKILVFAIILVVGLTACKIKSSVSLKSSTDSTIFVDYNKGVHEMLLAGKYGWFDNQLISDLSFPHPAGKIGKQETLTVKIVHFSGTLSEAQIRDSIGQNYRPATLAELLAFGAQYPEFQTKHPIAAIGSFWQDYGGAPFLGYNSDRRIIDINWNHYEWSGDYYFGH